ncbi:ankyrin repeat domain-containing protein [Fadolivirus algeromassiliense]|jgi:ankyrin repeat protein|uniref:Ankyrin repeat domain-containing protein n=1 Tax=Fadolivirus FV1/VV64 TaxID=3070911 RepID=A0A7D3USG5_9VIRU|nr:ankyrin repeat domain-containing protein [Fadolivirus algeromassiliense]QKF93550.1 ankyrin repeat domain-containing protein [Fadolivirus FV1/VV64]
MEFLEPSKIDFTSCGNTNIVYCRDDFRSEIEHAYQNELQKRSEETEHFAHIRRTTQLLYNCTTLEQLVTSGAEIDFHKIFKEGSHQLISDIVTNKFNQLLSDSNIKHINDYFIDIVKRGFDTKILNAFVQYVNINYQDTNGNTPLMYICINGNNGLLEWILNINNIDVSLTNDKGMNALMLSIEKCHFNCANILSNYIKYKCNDDTKNTIVNQHTIARETSISIALEKSHNQLINLCLSLGVNVNTYNLSGNCPLYHTIENNNEEIFNLLINAENTDVNLQDFNGTTLLMYASTKLNKVFFDKLLAHKNININLVDNEGRNILTYILYNKYNGKTTPNSIGSLFDGKFASYPACYDPNNVQLFDVNNTKKNMETIYLKTISLLLERNIDVNKPDMYNNTPLNYAINNKDQQAFRLIVNSKQFDPNFVNSDGKTYLMMLFDLINNNSRKDNVYVAQDEHFMPYSISNGTSIGKLSSIKPVTQNNSNKNNADQQYLSFFVQLLQHPLIDINITDYYGNTILLYVCNTNNLILLKSLLANNTVNINLHNYLGETPLSNAVKSKHWNIVGELLKAGVISDVQNNWFDSKESECIYQNLVKNYAPKQQLPINEPKNQTVVKEHVKESENQTVIIVEKLPEKIVEPAPTKKGWFF